MAGQPVGNCDFNENPVVHLDLDFDLGFVNYSANSRVKLKTQKLIATLSPKKYINIYMLLYICLNPKQDQESSQAMANTVFFFAMGHNIFQKYPEEINFMFSIYRSFKYYVNMFSQIVDPHHPDQVISWPPNPPLLRMNHLRKEPGTAQLGTITHEFVLVNKVFFKRINIIRNRGLII